MRPAVYARVSSDAQDTDLSISAQIRALTDCAARNNTVVVREFIDEAESGRTADRPAFREMIALAKSKNPPFDTILVWKLNRFARSRIDSIVYKKLLKDRGIRLISINEPIDDSPTGHLTEGMIEAIDQFYSENMGQDIRRGIRESARRGFYTSSLAPFGMHKVLVKDGSKTRYRLEPDSQDSTSGRIVRTIFDMAANGTGCKDIAKALNKDGLRTGTGQRWGRTTVHKVLTNEAYCGTLVLGGRAGHPAAHSGIGPVIVEAAWPALVDRETFMRIKATMGEKRPENTHPRVVGSTFLLSGLVHCSCGHAMIGRSAKSHQYHYYTCNGNYKQGAMACTAKTLPRENLERAVVAQIRDKVLNDEWLDELVRRVNEELDSGRGLLSDKLDCIDDSLAEVRARLSRLYEALETGKLSLDDLAPRIKDLRVREADLSKARLQIEAEVLAKEPHRVDAEAIKTHARDLKAILDESDTAASRAFLKTFVKRIEIAGSDAVIRYTLPIPPEGETEARVPVLPIETPGGEGGI